MTFEYAKHRDDPDTWVVEAIDHSADGAVYVASFSGPNACERAKEYAQWKNGLARRARRRGFVLVEVTPG